jgi:hypothetical protein
MLASGQRRLQIDTIRRKVFIFNTFRPNSAWVSALLLTGLFQVRVLVGELDASLESDLR